MNLNFFFDLLFPTTCLACAKRIGREEALCPDCAGKINFYRTLFCGRCGARLPDERKICHLDHPYILGAATNYHEPPVEALVKSLKFGRAKNAAPLLGSFLADYFRPLGISADYMIVPIPLGKERLKERGFNQAELIAEAFSHKLNLPIELRALSRTKNTLPQSSIRGHRERLDNVQGAFTALQDLVAGKNIILVDDVTTSGATFYEATTALKSAGAKKIIALAAAKA